MRAVRVRALIVALALALAPFEGPAAQDFPSRPVRFLVPYAAGGSGDLLARLLGNKLASIWGQQVVVDNRPGAGGLIGTEFAAHSEPDGYTLYLATDGPLTIAATLYKRVPYDWKRDFAPVSMLAMGYQVLLVGRSLPARTVQELVALARQKPGELNYASIGIGSAPHLAAELFKSVAKVDITHVPYRGSSAQAIAALIAGDVSMFLVGTSTAVPYIQSGAVQGLAVTSSHRVQGLPDVPTFAEAGLPASTSASGSRCSSPAARRRQSSASSAPTLRKWSPIPSSRTPWPCAASRLKRARPSSWRSSWTRTTSSFAISSASSACRWNDAAARRYARRRLSCEAGLATLNAGHDICPA